MPTLDEVTEFVNNYTINPTITKNGIHFHCRCPICGDSTKSKHKKRFHLQFFDNSKIVWNCFNCEESGNFYQLYSRIIGVSEKEAYRIFNKYSGDLIKGRLQPKTISSEKKISESLKLNYILKDCLALDDTVDGYIQKQYHSKLKDFIKKRKVNRKVFVAYKGYYKNRIIIPVYYYDDIIYFQGRAINDNMTPKYLNPVVEKQNVILNKYNFDKDKFIIVTEGLLDAYAVGNQGTSIIGKSLNKDFLETIGGYTNKGVIIVMDNDNTGLQKTDDFIRQFPQLKYFIMPKKYRHLKDLNDIIVNINNINIYKFVLENSMTALRAKVILNGDF